MLRESVWRGFQKQGKALRPQRGPSDGRDTCPLTCNSEGGAEPRVGRELAVGQGVSSRREVLHEQMTSHHTNLSDNIFSGH